MFRTIFPLILIIGLLVTGCASSSTITPAATPTLPALTVNWTVKMAQSGGIMGLMRSLEISSNGIYTVTDDQTKKEITGRLSESELGNLSEAIAHTKQTNPEKPNIGICSDCFIYDIEIINGGEVSTLQLNDMSLPDSGMEGLVTSLRALMDTVLK